MRTEKFMIKRSYNWRVIDDVVSNRHMYNIDTLVEFKNPVNYIKSQ